MNTITTMLEKTGVILPPKYWVILGVALMGLFLIGLDQGQTLSAVMGEIAYKQQLLHELFHDLRHVAGFACH